MHSHTTTTPRASMNPQATRRALDSLVAQNAATGIVAKASWPFALARLAPNEASFGANLGCSHWSRSLQLLMPGRKLSVSCYFLSVQGSIDNLFVCVFPFKMRSSSRNLVEPSQDLLFSFWLPFKTHKNSLSGFSYGFGFCPRSSPGSRARFRPRGPTSSCTTPRRAPAHARRGGKAAPGEHCC